MVWNKCVCHQSFLTFLCMGHYLRFFRIFLLFSNSVQCQWFLICNWTASACLRMELVIPVPFQYIPVKILISLLVPINRWLNTKRVYQMITLLGNLADIHIQFSSQAGSQCWEPDQACRLRVPHTWYKGRLILGMCSKPSAVLQCKYGQFYTDWNMLVFYVDLHSTYPASQFRKWWLSWCDFFTIPCNTKKKMIEDL